MDLAKHIVQTKSGHFHPEKFEDRYEQALRDLIVKKQAGERIEVPKPATKGKVINLMDALRQSIEAGKSTPKKPPAPSRKERTKRPAARSTKRPRRSSARHRKAG
jgi:DNA end-binding protein Ku